MGTGEGHSWGYKILIPVNSYSWYIFSGFLTSENLNTLAPSALKYTLRQFYIYISISILKYNKIKSGRQVIKSKKENTKNMIAVFFVFSFLLFIYNSPTTVNFIVFQYININIYIIYIYIILYWRRRSL